MDIDQNQSNLSYKYKKPSKLELFFWYCAGADIQILKQCNSSDRVRYVCLGGIVFATGFMAALAGGYAFYTIFEPRGSAIDKNAINIGTALASMFFGFLWGAMIFNLDRFIVSSTGKGDGTEKITWDELKTAAPRIFMGLVIALTISKPIEIRMFKSEIDAALHEEQLVKEKEYEERTRAVFKERLLTNSGDSDLLKKKQDDWESSISKLEEELTNQLQGRAGVGPGDGPRAQALRTQKKELESKYERWKSENKSELERLSSDKIRLEKELNESLGKNKLVSNGLDGLLERIKLAHHIAGFWISLFITLLFVAIELTPILFKLTLTKTPYDYLKENVEQSIMAEKGIIFKQAYHDIGGGKFLDFVEFLPAAKIQIDKHGRQEIEKELMQYALALYKEKKKIEIENNPEKYLNANGYQELDKIIEPKNE